MFRLESWIRASSRIYFVVFALSIILSGWSYFYFRGLSKDYLGERASSQKLIQVQANQNLIGMYFSLYSMGVAANDAAAISQTSELIQKTIKQGTSIIEDQELRNVYSVFLNKFQELDQQLQKPENRNRLLNQFASLIQDLQAGVNGALKKQFDNQEKYRQDFMSSQLESGFIWRILFGLIAGLLLFLTVLRIAQNRTQEALIETEQLNSFLIGSLTEAILLINKEGIVRSCNKSACAMIRKSKEQIVGRPISVLMPNLLKSDQTSYRSNLHPFITLVLSGQVFTNIRLGLPMPDKIKWLRVNCQPLTVAGVDAGSCLFSITDITSLVEQEKELETQRMQLVQSSKLSALGEMAAGIAHEINNPLAVIRLEADAILESIEERQVDSSELQSSTEKIIGVVSRIAKIVRGLRTFARDGQVDPFKKEKVLDIVNDALALASIKIKQQGARIEVNIDEELWMECRVTQISQVLINLIHNSLDAIAGSESPWIRIEARVVQNMVDIAVVDSGAGLPAEVRDRIFHPFFTTKEVGKGTGLGLSISRGIAESHKGALFVDGSSMNTRFVLQLPHTQLENG